MTAAFIRRLTLTNFRSYHAAQVQLDRAGPVVLTGANGIGKTNLVEAVSLLAPGRGLRRATMEELAFSEGDGAWAVSAEIEGMLGLATLGTGHRPARGRRIRPHPQMPYRPRKASARQLHSQITCGWSG
jgi:DNA replication and repair protein RecF